MFANFIFAQNSNTTVATYKLSFSIDEKIEKNSRALSLFEVYNQGAELSNFILLFKGEQGNFSASPYNGLESEKWEEALIMAGFENLLFIDYSTNSIFYNNDEYYFPKNKYLIRKEIQQNWKISSDTMSINGIKCLKATMFEEIINSKGVVVKKEVTAWFAPEFPYQFGPNGYGKLPGLIIQLNSNRVNFYLDNIKFNSDIELHKVTLGSLISETEYELKLIKASEKMRGF
jgi:GLPGLI family protein